MSDLFPIMVYRVGDQEEMHGGRFDYELAHHQDSLDALLSNGWHLTTTEATAADKAAMTAPLNEVEESAPMLTREEIEAQAITLGIKFDGRTRDAKLLAMIDIANEKAAS